MRENRTSGSEGGGAGNPTGSPYPYLRRRVVLSATADGGGSWKIDCGYWVKTPLFAYESPSKRPESSGIRPNSSF